MPGAGTAAATHPVCPREQRQLRPQPHGGQMAPALLRKSAPRNPPGDAQGYSESVPFVQPSSGGTAEPTTPFLVQNHRKSVIPLLIPLWRLSAERKKKKEKWPFFITLSPWQRSWFAQPLFLSLTKGIKDREQRENWVRKGKKHHPCAGNMIQALRNGIWLTKGTKLATTVFFRLCERHFWHREKKWDLQVLFVIKSKAWSSCETNKEKTNLSADL